MSSGFTLTTLKVSNLDKSIEFYSGLLGMEVISRFEGAGNQIAMLGESDHAHLELICNGEPAPENPGAGVSVGFYVDDAQDTIQKLGQKAAGPISPNPHLQLYFVKDPDGYGVELLQEM